MIASEFNHEMEQTRSQLEKLYSDKGIVEQSSGSRYRGAMKTLRDAKNRRESESSASDLLSSSKDSPVLPANRSKTSKYNTLRARSSTNQDMPTLEAGYNETIEANLSAQASLTAILTSRSYLSYFEKHPELSEDPRKKDQLFGF